MRTQIDLDAEQHAFVKLKAAELGISIAEYLRRLVEQDLGQRGPRSDISDISDISHISDIGDSGGSDISVDRKAATAEAMASRAASRRAVGAEGLEPPASSL